MIVILAIHTQKGTREIRTTPGAVAQETLSSYLPNGGDTETYAGG